MASYSGAPDGAGFDPNSNVQQQHLHHQLSQVTLDRQHQQQPQIPQQQFQQPSAPETDAGAGPSRSNPFQTGLGFLSNKLGLERKTNRDGQPAKRRGPKPDSKPALTRRQELNRQAQRTHRQRKEVYIKSLEDQVMQLKELYSAESAGRAGALQDNQKLRALLRQHGITPPDPAADYMGSQGYLSGSDASDAGLRSQSEGYGSPSSYIASGSEHSGTQYGQASTASGHSTGTAHAAQHEQPFPDQLLQNNPAEDQAGIDFVLAQVPPNYYPAPAPDSNAFQFNPGHMSP